MGTKRKTYTLQGGRIIDTEEFHDGRYGAPGMKRVKKKKPTREDMQKVNAMNKARRTRQRLLQYFTFGDIFADLTYKVEERPPDMKTAVAQFGTFMAKVRKEFRKRGYGEVFWIRNIERGTKGAWHIHLVIKEIGDTESIIQKAWKYGGVWSITISKSEWNDEDFTKLANYMTKDENTREEKKDGTLAKPRIREASYNTSRNMPLPKPKVDKLVRWKSEVKPKKGYYIAKIHEGINPATGYKYRRYTMIRLERKQNGRE